MTVKVKIARLIATVYTAVVVTLAASTFLSPAVYGSWWFILLWILFAIILLLGITAVRMWRHAGTFILHISFIAMLGGGLATWLSSRKGTVRIPEGATVSTFTSENGEEYPLPAEITLEKFEILYYPGGRAPRDYVSHLQVGADSYSLSMNKILDIQGYRLYQNSYDCTGATFLFVNYDPFGIPLSYAGYVMFTIGGLLIMISQRRRLHISLKGAAYIALILAVAFGAIYTWHTANPREMYLMPVLNSPWLAVHVSLVMAAYALLAFTALAAMVALLCPAMELRLQNLSLTLLYPGVWLLGAGIFSGAIWANVSWGSYWTWDPKETWALVTMMIYAVPLHRSLSWLGKPRVFHVYLLISSLSIAMTYFGVNYLDSLHAYN